MSAFHCSVTVRTLSGSRTVLITTRTKLIIRRGNQLNVI